MTSFVNYVSLNVLVKNQEPEAKHFSGEPEPEKT